MGGGVLGPQTLPQAPPVFRGCELLKEALSSGRGNHQAQPLRVRLFLSLPRSALAAPKQAPDFLPLMSSSQCPHAAKPQSLARLSLLPDCRLRLQPPSLSCPPQPCGRTHFPQRCGGSQGPVGKPQSRYWISRTEGKPRNLYYFQSFLNDPNVSRMWDSLSYRP